MKKILNISSSINGENSFSTKLSNAIIEKLQENNPDSELIAKDLAKHPLPHLEAVHFTSFNTPDEARTAAQKEALQFSDQAVKELFDADAIVIGIGLYNFGIPSTLKSWIDHIARAGVTFSYADGYPKGLVLGKKVYLAIASGGVYTEGPMVDYDFTENYLRKTLGFLGLTDITTFRVEGLMMPQLAENAFPKVLHTIEEFTF